MSTYIIRTGGSNNRVTKGKGYKLCGLRIVDDRGKMMTPCLDPKYWEHHEEIPSTFAPPPWLSPPGPPETPNCRCTTIPLKPLENTMLTIESVVLINDRRSSELEITDLINLVVAEEAKIERLRVVKSKSKAINNLITRHEENIAALVSILDCRE